MGKGRSFHAAHFSALDVFMKILIATGIYPPDIGGPATYSKLLVENFPKYGLHPEVLSFGEVRHLPKIVRHFVYFLKVLRKGRYVDSIFAQDPVSVGLPTMLAAKILRKKFVLKIVGDYAWEQGVNRFGVTEPLDDFQKKRYGFRVELLRFIERRVARAAECIIVPSNYLKNIVMHWGVSASCIDVIYNAVETPDTMEDREALRRSSGFDGCVVVSVGRLVPWKGFTTLIDAVDELVGQGRNVKLYIIGDGPENEVLQSKITSHELQNRIFMTGIVSHETVLKYLKAADVFVLNTAYEGFAHQILEAMAIGVPVISTLAGGNAEILENGKNALVIKWGDTFQIAAAIRSLTRDHGTRENMIEAGKQTVRGFTTETMVTKTSDLFKSLANK